VRQRRKELVGRVDGVLHELEGRGGQAEAITETTALGLSPAPSNIDTTSLPVLVSPADEAVTQKPRASDSQVDAGSH
jgi:hypothetical protein